MHLANKSYSNANKNLKHILRVLSNYTYYVDDDNKIIQLSTENICDTIEKSYLIIFCLTNNYVKTDLFESELNAARNLKRFILFLLLEKIDQELLDKHGININDFKVIHFYNDTMLNQDDINLESEQMHRFCYLTFSFFGNFDIIVHELNMLNNNCGAIQENDEKFKLSFRLEKSIKLSHGNMERVFEFKENRHLITCSPAGLNNHQMVIYDNKLNLIKATGYKATCVCFIQHLNLLCIYDSNTKIIYLLDKSYNLIEKKTVIISNESENVSCKSNMMMLYNSENKLIYVIQTNTKFKLTTLLNDKFEVIKSTNIDIKNEILSVKFIIDKLYIVEAKLIHVYDFQMNYLASFGYLIIDEAADILIDDQYKNFIFVLEQRGSVLNVFNIESYVYIGHLNYDTNLHSACNGVIIQRNFYVRTYDKFMMYHINYRLNSKKALNIDYFIENGEYGSYICQLNPSNTHILSNPFELSCGFTACLGCLYEITNPYTNKFYCKKCIKFHDWENSLVKSNIIENNLKNICLKLIEYPIKNVTHAGMVN